MVLTDDALADKIVYLKKNHFMPNTDNEMPDVQRAIQSFYFCSKSTIKKQNDFLSTLKTPYDVQDEEDLDNDPFWFRITFCDYQVSDEFVREVNREYKRFQILNIAKDEFGRTFNDNI